MNILEKIQEAKDSPWTPGEVRDYPPDAGGCCFCLTGQECRFRKGNKHVCVNILQMTTVVTTQ